jgi:DNA helicase-2/ATP-dependent DNA helicase PcrA
VTHDGPHAPTAPIDASPTSYLTRLNDEQREAVTTVRGPLLILAGAGSGKTGVLTSRVVHLLKSGVEAESILAVTFTNKAAHEMKERVLALAGAAAKEVWVSTFHSTCCRILRMEAEALGYTKRFAIYDDDDQHRIVRQILVDLGYDLKVVPPGSVLSRIDHYKNRMVTVDQLVAEHRAHGNDPLVRVWRAYEEALRAADAVDFNDLIGKAVLLFESRPDVLAKYRARFEYVMVDEYQDTNRAQYRLLRMLAEEHRNLAVVGDDDQSIYAFRGADLRNILDFEADFPDAKVIRLEQNYRSTANILTLANAVVAQNQNRIAKELWTTTGGGAKVRFLVSDDPRAEARLVTAAIGQLRRRGVALGDIAIIYRTNAMSQPFEAALREASLPYTVVGGRQFYSRREIRDALAYLRLLLNPADDAAFLRVVNVPSRGIGATTLTRLREDAAGRGEPLMKAARSLGKGGDRAAKAVAGFLHLVDGLTEVMRTVSTAVLVQELLERSGYAKMLEDEDTHESRGRLDNLRQLLRDAAQFTPEPADAPPDERLGAWLDRISLSGKDEDIPEGGRVTLMTVHTSKGLEFPTVFVVQMNEGQFPHARAAEEPGGVEEERRLAYVAFTRAKQRLIVTRSRKSASFDAESGGIRTDDAAPSRFLFGVPTEVCDGDLPGEELDEDDLVGNRKPQPPPSTAQRKLAALQAHAATQRAAAPATAPRPMPPAAAPSGDHTLMEIESDEDLTPGARVWHDQFGAGTIVSCSSAALRVRFSDRERRLTPPLQGLSLLRGA